MIYTIRTTSGREDMVIEMLASKIKAEGLDIKAAFHPAEIKGYIFVEGRPSEIHRAMHGLMHVKGFIEKPVSLSDIQHFLEAKKDRIKIEKGDIAEIIGGPFKGERGKIERIDKVKDEVTIELLEASIPIPVTISTEFIKIVRRAKKEEKPEESASETKEEETPRAEQLTEETAGEKQEKEKTEEADKGDEETGSPKEEESREEHLPEQAKDGDEAADKREEK